MSDVARRAAVIEALIPAPPPDIAPLRIAFCSLVSRQWEAHVPIASANALGTVVHAQSAKIRFIAEMYARACYSMLLVSPNGPLPLRLLVQATATLPLSRGLAIRLGSHLFASLDWLVPQALHRQLLLTSTLMGMLPPAATAVCGHLQRLFACGARWHERRRSIVKLAASPGLKAPASPDLKSGATQRLGRDPVLAFHWFFAM
jgi:hypothetical protein